MRTRTSASASNLPDLWPTNSQGLPKNAKRQSISLLPGLSPGNCINSRQGSIGLGELDRALNEENLLIVSDSLQRLSQFVFWGKTDGDVEDKYELGEEIGRGSFGVVRKAKDITTGGQLCCKSMLKASFSAAQLAELQHETEVMLHLRGHPNIVTIMGVFEDEEHLHIAQELCDGGSLADILTKKGRLSERATRRAMYSVLSMLAHCHSMHVLYRDVKPEHFLVVSVTDKTHIKAIDFGISLFLKPGQKCDMAAGTPSYWAPEVFDLEYGYPSDLWACGVMMHVLLSGEVPFKGKTEPELYRAVRSGKLDLEGERWRRVSEPGRQLLRRLLSTSATERITAADALHHPWFMSRSSSKLSLSVFNREDSFARALAHCRSPATPQESSTGGSSSFTKSSTSPRPHVVLERMRSYSRMCPLKRAVMHLVVRELNQGDNLAGMQAMFGGMDTDQTGTLSVDEIMAALHQQGSSGVELEEVQRLVEELDVNSDGELDAMEFLAAAMNRSLLERQGLLAAAFRRFDCDCDGIITPHDLDTVNIEDRTLQTLLTQAKASVLQEHGIDFEQFVGMMLEPDPSCPPKVPTRAGVGSLRQVAEGCVIM